MREPLDGWCKLVHTGAVTSGKRFAHPKRFSVTVERGDWEELNRIANGHRPPLSLQYVVNFALQRFLRESRDPQLALKLGNPTDDGED
ncbi:MAG: hypothetical protein KIT84_10975 [Labilithrix sp.]|nr:hypothetical protein [Labilithrix sp.]